MTGITTTNKEFFSDRQSANMAWLVYLRFGRNLDAATRAWNRLLQNNCDSDQFQALFNNSNYDPDSHED